MLRPSYNFFIGSVSGLAQNYVFIGSVSGSAQNYVFIGS